MIKIEIYSNICYYYKYILLIYKSNIDFNFEKELNILYKYNFFIIIYKGGYCPCLTHIN